jgi:putative membrane protein
MRLHRANIREIEIARMAEEKAASSLVRALARRINWDNALANRRLLIIADSKNVALPIAAPAHTGKRENQLQALQKTTGLEFDREFISLMRESQEEKLLMLQEAKSQFSGDSKLQVYLSKFSPLFEQHRSVTGNLLHTQPGSKT